MPDGKLRIAFVTPEAAPFAKSGELADVAGSLPKYLAHLGAEVSVFLPKYRLPEIESMPMELVVPKLSVPLGTGKIKASVYRAEPGKFTLFLIDNPKYFMRENIYGPSTGEYLDNDERFVFFNRAVLEFMARSLLRFDVIHCHSWPAGLVPVFLKTHYAHKPVFRETSSLLTLHNVAYQGEFPADSLALAGLSWNGAVSEKLPFDGKFNFLKTGIVFSDALNTVSRSYRREILSGKEAHGLSAVLKSRRPVLESIRDGVDYEEWDPRTDPYIAANFGPDDIAGKAACRKDLIKEFGLSLSEREPVVGMVSYLTRAKGFDLLHESVLKLLDWNLGLVVLGRGGEIYENLLRKIKERRPGKTSIRFEMNPALSHKVIAGSDILLMPSLVEPCGLTPLYAFRYGTVPVVRATGGLKEIVASRPGDPGAGNGFSFSAFTPRALLKAMHEALTAFRKPGEWKRLMDAGFRQDHSCATTARAYLDLYYKITAGKKGNSHVR